MSFQAGAVPVPADYDADGRTNVALFSAAAWGFYDFATGAYLPHLSVWTGGGGRPLPGDYGDGKADLALFANGVWHLYKRNNTYNRGIWIGGGKERPLSDLPPQLD